MTSPLFTITAAQTAVAIQSLLTEVGLVEPHFHLPLAERGLLAQTTLFMLIEQVGIAAIGPQHVLFAASLWAENDQETMTLANFVAGTVLS